MRLDITGGPISCQRPRPITYVGARGVTRGILKTGRPRLETVTLANQRDAGGGIVDRAVFTAQVEPLPVGQEPLVIVMEEGAEMSEKAATHRRSGRSSGRELQIVRTYHHGSRVANAPAAQRLSRRASDHFQPQRVGRRSGRRRQPNRAR